MSRVKDLEGQLEHTEQQLRLLQKISRFMVRDMRLAESFHGVVALVVEFMECDSCLLYLLKTRNWCCARRIIRSRIRSARCA